METVAFVVAVSWALAVIAVPRAFGGLHDVLVAAASPSTQPGAPALPDIPDSWTGFLYALGGFVTALTAFLALILPKLGRLQRGQQVLTDNTQTLAAGVDATTQAIRQSPGPNVPAGVQEAVRAILDDPTVSAPPPGPTDPVRPPDPQPKVQT